MGLAKTLAFNISGHALHSIFFEESVRKVAANRMARLVVRSTNTLDRSMPSGPKSPRRPTPFRGSEWGALVWERLGGLIIGQIYDHQGSVANGSMPFLVFDGWEHAYYLQYKNVRADFVAALWNVIDWDDVARRFKSAAAESIQ